jgi:tyrosine-protein phosphatase non-receptor type 13 protein
VISERLEDNFILGLAALLGGNFAFLPHKTKLHKVAPVGWHGDSKKVAAPICTFTLYLRVKFFMPSLRGVRYVSGASTLHTTYLFI